MKFSSAYELKKRLKARGYDLEGVQVKQKADGFLVCPLDDIHSVQSLLHELARELAGSNAEVELAFKTNLTSAQLPVSIGT